jgi:Domain of unknown function DUF21.
MALSIDRSSARTGRWSICWSDHRVDGSGAMSRSRETMPNDANIGEQDEIHLQVIKTSGEGAEKKNASSVLKLLQKGKHWVLVTLLLSNVITNETLPIILDRSLGGGWPAVVGSTVLIGTQETFYIISVTMLIAMQSYSERLFHSRYAFDMVFLSVLGWPPAS